MTRREGTRSVSDNTATRGKFVSADTAIRGKFVTGCTIERNEPDHRHARQKFDDVYDAGRVTCVLMSRSFHSRPTSKKKKKTSSIGNRRSDLIAVRPRRQKLGDSAGRQYVQGLSASIDHALEASRRRKGGSNGWGTSSRRKVPGGARGRGLNGSGKVSLHHRRAVPPLCCDINEEDGVGAGDVQPRLV